MSDKLTVVATFTLFLTVLFVIYSILRAADRELPALREDESLRIADDGAADKYAQEFDDLMKIVNAVSENNKNTPSKEWRDAVQREIDLKIAKEHAMRTIGKDAGVSTPMFLLHLALVFLTGGVWLVVLLVWFILKKK